MKNFFLVIPTRDRIDFLSNLLLDLNAFDQYISQVVIVDQSVEDNKENIEKLDLKYSHLLVKNSRDNSVNHSRNRALNYYNDEDWLFFLDDDLRIPRLAFEQIIKTLEPNIIDVLIPGIQFEGMEKAEFVYHTILDTIAKPHNFSKGRFRLQVCSGLNIVKRSMFKEAGFYFDENFTIWGDDLDYGMRLLQAGAIIYYQPKILVEHLPSYSGGQRDKSNFLNVDLEKRKLYFYFIYKHFSSTVTKREVFFSFLISLKLMFLKRDFKGFKNNILAYNKFKTMLK